jgi:hypothetical protein
MTKRDFVAISESITFCVTVHQVIKMDRHGMGFHIKPEGKSSYYFASLKTEEVFGSIGIMFEIPDAAEGCPHYAWLGKTVEISITQLEEPREQE